MFAQRFHVAGPVVGFAEAVDDQRHLSQSQPGVELPGEGDDLDIEMGVVGAEHLDTDLVELTVPAPLRLLVAKIRTRVADLPWRGRPVFDERTTHTGGHLGPQSDVTVALVDEVVHLLGDDVGGVADPGEDPEILEQRGDQLPVACAFDHVGEDFGETAPATALGRKDVPHAGTGLER